jgi:hypothetical protein
MGIDARILIKSKRIRTDEEVLDLAYRMASALGPGMFWIDREGLQHCLTIVNDEYTQDGDSIFPEPDEQLIEVNLLTRYYGIGYERGPIQDHIAIANFIEEIMPDAEVWYGGDSSGVCVRQFDKTERDRVWKHFCAVGHAPYHNFFAENMGTGASPICTLCHKPYVQYGFGQNYKAYSCSGCGHHLEYRDGKLVDKKIEEK